MRAAGGGGESGLARGSVTVACATSGGVRTFKAVANAAKMAVFGSGDIV